MPWEGNEMLLILFKLISLLSDFFYIWSWLNLENVIAAPCATNIPANELASEWSKLFITANVNCVGEKWLGSGVIFFFLQISGLFCFFVANAKSKSI